MKTLFAALALTVSATGFADDAHQPVAMMGSVPIGAPIELPEGAEEAFGEGKYCLVNISNDTSHPVSYKHEWHAPNQKQQSHTTKPGWCTWFSLKCTDLPPYGRRHFKVRFNYNTGEGTGYKNHTLISGRSEHQTCEDGPEWSFKKKSKTKIKLVQTRDEPRDPDLQD